MSAKSVFCAALLVAVLGYGAAHGQSPSPPMAQGSWPGKYQAPYTPVSPLDEPLGRTGVDEDAYLSRPTPERPGKVSQWITGPRSECCFGPFGGDGPIRYEVFGRTGVSIPFGSGIYGRSLQPGVMLSAGGRTLLFDEDRSAAWTLELGLTSIWNHSSRPDIQIPMSILVPNAQGIGTRVNFGEDDLPGVTTRALNRTTLDVAFGRECWLWGAPGCGGYSWRAGVDVGGRWGSARADFHEIRHRTDVIGGTFAAVHTDLECPCGCCTYLAGFRAEWAYTWTDILQHQNRADVMEINLLLNFGVRF